MKPSKIISFDDFHFCDFCIICISKGYRLCRRPDGSVGEWVGGAVNYCRDNSGLAAAERLDVDM